MNIDSSQRSLSTWDEVQNMACAFSIKRALVTLMQFHFSGKDECLVTPQTENQRMFDSITKTWNPVIGCLRARQVLQEAQVNPKLQIGRR